MNDTEKAKELLESEGYRITEKYPFDPDNLWEYFKIVSAIVIGILLVGRLWL